MDKFIEDEHIFEIAIVGMACKFPGANNIDEFWNNLKNGVESISHFDDEELLNSGVDASYLKNPTYVKASPVIDGPGLFDAKFFGYTPHEAKSLDPQHRIILECSYNALEHAGYDPSSYEGPIGVFTGSAMNTYFMNGGFRENFNDEYIPTLIGNDKDFLSTRISYKLDLKGPSINIQTACSTSLVAVHLACQSLLNEESDMALAGAISVKAPHKAGYICDGAGIVSPDARVSAFDKNANGTVFGSGGGIIVLKRLKDALDDGDTIHAVIKGSSVNNDGSGKVGYTAPSVESQSNVMIEAIANAGIDAEDITYLEAHGSGTPVGDPIEVAALSRAFRVTSKKNNFCAIGSVKTNIGHLDVAAGIAGIIKSVLAIKYKEIPPSLNYSYPNPEINFQSTPFFVNTTLSKWKSSGARIAAVNATGMGGTNSAVILQEAPKYIESRCNENSKLFIYSAKNETSLKKYEEKLGQYFKTNEDVNLDEVAYTLQLGRKSFNHRKYFVCKNKIEASEILNSGKSKRLFSNKLDPGLSKSLIFLFSGIGDQYVGMGQELYNENSIFRDEVDKCAQILENIIGIDIRDIVYPKDYIKKQNNSDDVVDLKKLMGYKNDDSADKFSENLNKTIHAQTVLFTLEYSLAKLWMSYGLEPSALVGHSMGEYVAACLSGVFSLEDALYLVSKRAMLVNELPVGAMLAVTLSESELLPLLTSDISISLINGPKLCVIAGPVLSVKNFEKILLEKQILFRYIQNSHAFHSKMMNPIIEDYLHEVKKINLNKPQIPFISNVSGNWITDDEATNPNYWVSHTTETARFSQALYKMWDLQNNVLLEIGPGKTLSILAMQHFTKKNIESPEIAWSLKSNYENYNDNDFLLQSLGKLWSCGFNINWNCYYEGKNLRRIPLPTYQFDRENYWYDISKESSLRKSNSIKDLEMKNGFSLSDYLSSISSDKIISELLKSHKFRKVLPTIIERLIDSQTRHQSKNNDNFAYQLKWKPENNHGNIFNISGEVIFEKLSDNLKRLMFDNMLKSYSQLANEFNELSISYIIDAFVELGFNFIENEKISPQLFINNYNVVENKKGFLLRLINILTESNFLKKVNNDWIVIRGTIEKDNSEIQLETLLNKYPHAEIELDLLQRSGKNLSKILLGNNSPLELLFPEGDLASATKLYQDSPVFYTMNSLLKSAIKLLTAMVKSNKKIKILEIGAGTGGTTSRLMPILKGLNCSYTFTDVSNLFLNNAKARFDKFQFVDYKLLDIGMDPSQQGFEEKQYDIILASNALHATESIDSTIQNVRKILSPGGFLLVLEGTTPQYWFDLFSGGLDGWMKFKDYELRNNHPLISNKNWEKILLKNEFNNIQFLDPGTIQEMGLFGQVIIIAQNSSKKELSREKYNGDLVIFADKNGISKSIANNLDVSFDNIINVHKGNEFELIDELNININPNKIADCDKVFENYGDKKFKILYLWSLDSGISNSLTSRNILKNIQDNVEHLLTLTKALKEKQYKTELYIVTSEAQSIGNKKLLSGLSQSPMWGLVQSLNREYPEFCTKIYDIDITSVDYSLSQLKDEIIYPSNLNQVVFRNKEKFIPRMENIDITNGEVQQNNNLNIGPYKTYLVSGGLGFLGLKLIRWLVGKGAKKIIAVNRTALPNRSEWKNVDPNSKIGRIINDIGEIEGSGAKIETEAIDISDIDQVKQLISKIKKNNQAVNGIIHAAGVYEYREIPNMSSELLGEVLTPKICGAWNLHETTLDSDLDFFISFSSISSIWGAKGQAHYSAANKFLDEFAHYRNSLGLPALTVNWGKFKEPSMISKEYHDKLSSIGIDGTGFNESFDLLEELSMMKIPQAIIAKIEWQKFKLFFTPNLSSDYFEFIESENQPKSFANTTQLDESESGDNDSVLDIIMQEISDTLGININQISEEDSLNFLGLDSLMAVGLRNRINKRTGIIIPQVKFMDGSSISSIVEEFGSDIKELDDEMIEGTI